MASNTKPMQQVRNPKATTHITITMTKNKTNKPYRMNGIGVSLNNKINFNQASFAEIRCLYMIGTMKSFRNKETYPKSTNENNKRQTRPIIVKVFSSS